MNDVQQIQNSPVKSKLFRCFENFISIDAIFIILHDLMFCLKGFFVNYFRH